jgi:hypothetical protein
VTGRSTLGRKVRAIALACVVTAITLAVADGLLRLATNGPVYQIALPATPMLSRYNANATAEELTAGDLGVATKDTSDDEPRRVKTTIDSFGFRNDEAAGQGVVDLVLLGDSFGFGGGTTQDKTMASRLRDRSGLSTYNLSMPWTGPWAQYVNLSLESRRLKLREGATVVWLLFTGNDLDDTYGDLDVDRLPRNGPAGQLWMTLKRIRNRSPLYRLLGRARADLTGVRPAGPATVVVPGTFLNAKKLLFLKPYVEASQLTYPDVVGHENYAALRNTIAATAQLAGRLKVSLKVVLAPTKEEVYGWLLAKGDPWSTSPEPSGFGVALRELCANAGIPFLDLKPGFIAESKALFDRSGQILWWYDDTHWNEHGHDLAASIVHRELLARQAGTPPRDR